MRELGKTSLGLGRRCSFLFWNTVLLWDMAHHFVGRHFVLQALQKREVGPATVKPDYVWRSISKFITSTLKLCTSEIFGQQDQRGALSHRRGQCPFFQRLLSLSASSAGISAFSNFANSTANQLSSKLRSSSGINEKRTPARPALLAFTILPVA